MRVLNLAHNNLSGQIPKFLGELPLLGYVNLSGNNFDGEMPAKGVFTNASAFSVAGNDKLCGGIKALQLHECPKQRRKTGVHRKVVILASCAALFLLLVVASACAVIRRKKQKKVDLLWPHHWRRNTIEFPIQNLYMLLVGSLPPT